MRSKTRLLFALASLAFAAAPAAAAVPDRTPVPESGPCDIVLTPADAPNLERLLNDAGLRVFCVEAGDYRSAGLVFLRTQGTPEARRYLRFHPEDGVPNAMYRSERAIFEALRIRSKWWVIQGITVQPKGDERSNWFLGIEGGDHNVVEGNLIDGIDFPNPGLHAGVEIHGLVGDGATYNLIRSNVIRRGNQRRLGVDYIGVAIAVGKVTGEDNDFNQILDNEIYDWGDGISLASGTEDCSPPGEAHGTVIDGNDIYITGDKRVNCDGTPNPDGDCSCSENAVEIKHEAGPEPHRWTRVTNNRFWGFRPTSEPRCGSSGGNGQAINAGTPCAGYVLVAGNVISDAFMGVKPEGPGWVIAGNLLHDLGRSIFPAPGTNSMDIEFNTFVGADNAYEDNAADVLTRCNAVIDDRGITGWGTERGADHETAYNYLYDAADYNFPGPTNQVFPLAEQSGNEELCVTRRRWTGPEQLCVPLARTTASSPHAVSVPHCDPELGAPFELGSIGFASIQRVPEPAGLASGAALALAACAAARRRR
jgi:hypothetical protein